MEGGELIVCIGVIRKTYAVCPLIPIQGECHLMI